MSFLQRQLQVILIMIGLMLLRKTQMKMKMPFLIQETFYRQVLSKAMDRI